MSLVRDGEVAGPRAASTRKRPDRSRLARDRCLRSSAHGLLPRAHEGRRGPPRNNRDGSRRSAGGAPDLSRSRSGDAGFRAARTAGGNAPPACAPRSADAKGARSFGVQAGRRSVDGLIIGRPRGPTRWRARRALTRFPEIVDRFDGAVYRRLLLVGRAPVLATVEQAGSPARARLHVTLAGRGADSAAARAEVGRILARSLGYLLDVRPFYRAFRTDPLLGLRSAVLGAAAIAGVPSRGGRCDGFSASR